MHYWRCVGRIRKREMTNQYAEEKWVFSFDLKELKQARKECWCPMKLLYLGRSSVYAIQPCTSLQCHLIRSHLCWVHVCLAATCHLHFWQNDQNVLHATRVEQISNQKSAQKVNPGGGNPPAVPARTQTQDLSIRSPSLYH